MKLTEPQRRLLTEVVEAGTLYVNQYQRYGRTISVLQRKGAVRCTEPDYSPLAMHGYVATDEGKAAVA